MYEHSPEFITSEFTVSTDDADKVAAVKAALAANVHVFVFIYMDNCGHCMAAEAAWVEFTKEVNKRSNAEAFAVSSAMMGEFGTALGDAKVSGVPTFRCVHNGKATDYNGGRSVSDLIGWMDGTTHSQPQSGGKNTTKNPFKKAPRQQTSFGKTSTGYRRGPTTGTVWVQPTPMAQHMPTPVPTYVPPFATNIGGRRKKGSKKRRKTRKTRKPRKPRKTRKTKRRR